MNCTHSSDTRGAAHSCQPLSTSLRYPLGQVCEPWSFSSCDDTRHTRGRRDGLSLLEMVSRIGRHRSELQRIRTSFRMLIVIIVEKEDNFWKNFFFSKNRRSWWKMNYINLGCLGLREKDPAPGRLNYTSQRPDAQISSFLGPRGFN